jgi:nucleoside-diphosphate-sugar epimerase
MKNKKVVITGASGFIGKHLKEYFEKYESLDVIATTRKSIPGYFQVKDYAKIPRGEILIHLAENNLNNASEKETESVTLNKLEEISNMGFSRVIYFSSAAVYSDKFTTPRKESDPVFENSNYVKNKLKSEKIISANPNNIIVRLSNVYGPGMSSSNVLSHILNQLTARGSILVENAYPERDFVWVGDIPDAIYKLAFTPWNSNSNIYNVGTGQAISIGALAKKILFLVDQPDREVVSRMKKTISSYLAVDYSKILDDCGWISKTSLDEGLRLMLKFEKSVIT